MPCRPSEKLIAANAALARHLDRMAGKGPAVTDEGRGDGRQSAAAPQEEEVRTEPGAGGEG